MDGLQHHIEILANGQPLSEAESEELFQCVLRGTVPATQLAAALMAMRVRGETVPEIVGAVRALRGAMARVAAPDFTIDVCGTGGDRQNTLNISTAVAFVLAGLGVSVAKHGNRAVSSRSGAADVLSELGIGFGPDPQEQAQILRDVGCAFLFAPNHHPALQSAAQIRAELGVRTIFNLLGPLLNPAEVRHQLVGVFDAAWTQKLAEVLRETGSRQAWVVHGQGLDELSLAGANQVAALQHGAVRLFSVRPEDAGLAGAPHSAIRGGDAKHNAAALEAMLRGARGAYRDTVLLNSAAALIVVDRVGTLPDGVALAERSVDSGAALDVLARLRRSTHPEVTQA